MRRPNDARKAASSTPSARRRFLSLLGGITAGLTFASRAVAASGESSQKLLPASPGDARKDDTALAIARRHDFKRDRFDLVAETAPAAITYVEEVSASYIYDAGSTATPDDWILLGSAAGGTYRLTGSSLTLPIIGRGSDDWPNFLAAANACAASGITLRFGPGVYTCKSGGLALPSNLHIVCNPLTEIVCDISFNGDNRDAPFLAFGRQFPIDAQIKNDMLASDTNIGDMKITLTSSPGDLSPGDFVVLAVLQYRTAIYEVLAFDPMTQVVSLDRPLRLPYGSSTAITSFPTETIVMKFDPARNIHIEFNGARIYGKCGRFIEAITAWKCNFDGPVYCGDGTAATALERIMSIDAPSYDCHARKIYGNGGGVTPLGISFESSEGSTFEYCDIRNTVDAALSFQDAVDCVAIECRCNNNRGDGAVFTAAEENVLPTGSGSVLGSDHCKIVGGSFSGNGAAGIVFEHGSSRCVVDGAQVLSNPGGGIVDRHGNDNLVTGKTVVRRNFTGVRTEAQSVRFNATNVQATDQTNGIIVETGAEAVMLTGVNANFNSAAVIIRGEADVSQLSAVASPGTTTPQFSVEARGIARVRGLVAAQGAAPGSPFIDVAGTLDMESGLAKQHGGGIGINVKKSGVARLGPMVNVKGHGNVGAGLNVVDAGTVVIAANPEIDQNSVFVAETARVSFGTAVVGENGKINVAWPLLQTIDSVDLMRKSGTGDFSVELTPGTGFTLTGTPGDQFNWKLV